MAVNRLAPFVLTTSPAGRVAASIPVGHGPISVAVDPDTNTVYVADCQIGEISVINGATNVAGRGQSLRASFEA